MTKPRRTIDAGLKTKIALEGLQEQATEADSPATEPSLRLDVACRPRAYAPTAR